MDPKETRFHEAHRWFEQVKNWVFAWDMVSYGVFLWIGRREPNTLHLLTMIFLMVKVHGKVLREWTSPPNRPFFEAWSLFWIPFMVTFFFPSLFVVYSVILVINAYMWYDACIRTRHAHDALTIN